MLKELPDIDWINIQGGFHDKDSFQKKLSFLLSKAADGSGSFWSQNKQQIELPDSGKINYPLSKVELLSLHRQQIFGTIKR